MRRASRVLPVFGLLRILILGFLTLKIKKIGKCRYLGGFAARRHCLQCPVSYLDVPDFSIGFTGATQALIIQAQIQTQKPI